jgi:hypothetical protein
MPQERLRLGVVAIRRPPVTRWGKGELRPTAVLPQEPDTAPHTLIAEAGGTETWYLGAADMVLWPGDTGHHRDNLVSGRPSIWVALRGQNPERAEIACITADPYEGEGYAGDPALIVEAVPMPQGVGRFVADFIDAHHEEIPFKKRKRSPQDPNAMQSRAPRILPPEEKWGAGRRKP